MTYLIQRFFAICLLRAGPQNLPDNPFLITLTVIAYLIAGLLITTLQQPLVISLALIAVDFTLLSVLLYLLLWSRQQLPRYRRSISALLGSGAILEIIALPIIRWQQQVNIESTFVSNSLLLSSLLLWIWLFWNVIVVAHILKQAMSTRFIVGMSLAIFYLYLSFQASGMIVKSLGA